MATGHSVDLDVWRVMFEADDHGIPLTVPEVRRLPAVLVFGPVRGIQEVLRRSQWRRRHQAHLRRCHYQRRAQP
ncbi:hypothetical protein ABT061_03470 [Streptosporangium sp. NPDC002544]|uniref:hypothetical protein n=1 Tax=Streptosporangium sp. NPDC002544 TaxID=3154538 RepID=UPI00332BBD75